jgi:hypothetical protein
LSYAANSAPHPSLIAEAFSYDDRQEALFRAYRHRRSLAGAAIMLPITDTQADGGVSRGRAPPFSAFPYKGGLFQYPKAVTFADVLYLL